MSKTGGGPGTNQYGIKGVGKGGPPRRPPLPALPSFGDEPSRDWGALLAQYPTLPADFQARPEPEWTDFSRDLSDITPKGVERARARHERRKFVRAHSDAVLEGFAFTEPQIEDILHGRQVPGATVGHELQVRSMAAAERILGYRLDEMRPLEPTQELSDELHAMIATSLQVHSPSFRGDQKARYDGPEVYLDRGERFRALDARLTHEVLDAGLERISQIEHPVARGATWAAFSAYHQFYFDGNKRTGRLVMNGVLISHGYDAIEIPAARKSDYADALIDSFRTGRLDRHIEFLVDLYDDGGRR